MHPSKTVSFHSRTTFSAVLAITFCALACVPGEIASSGGETFGSETAGDGDGDPASSNDQLPMPGTEVVCVEMMPGAVTCWVDWSPGVHARVLTECQAAAQVSAGLWYPAVEFVIEPWGQVLCHVFIGAAGSVCVYGGPRVMLTAEDGVWGAKTSTSVGLYPAVAAPCGDGSVPLPPSCGTDSCPAGYGCTIADTCVDCDFVTGVYGCSCNTEGECESTSVCDDGLCSSY